MFNISTFADFLHTVNDKVGGYLWAILAGALVLLFVILFIVIACKNRRIKKLKKELKNTRTQLETERAKFDEERTRFESEKTDLKKESARLKSERDKLESAKAETDSKVDRVEADDASDAPTEEEIEQMWQQLSYYNRPTEVSQKDGNVKYTVLYDRTKDSWVIKRDGVNRVVRRVDTKEEAMSIARSLCKKNDARLVVHKKDGKFQKH